MKDDLKAILDRQAYRVYGEHAAVKLCHWMKESMLHGRQCYKQDFYGIKSHRCLQMTPVVNDCTHNCLFCWRVRGFESTVHEWKEPEEMLDALIEQQRKLVSGFKGDPRCSKQMWDECRDPKQVAISLAGEPTMYPYLSDLIALCKRRGMTTFLVTNGTFPDVLENMDMLPTQLYVTVAAPNEEIYKNLCVPAHRGRLGETDEDARTVPFAGHQDGSAPYVGQGLEPGLGKGIRQTGCDR